MPRRPLSRACARLLAPRRSAARLLAARRSSARLLGPLVLAIASCTTGSGGSEVPATAGADARPVEPESNPPAETPPDYQDYHPTAADAEAGIAEARAGNRFAEALYTKVGGQPGNLFMSPLSVRIALAMTYAGARGETATEMANALHFVKSGDALHGAMNALQGTTTAAAGSPQALAIANRLWGARGEGFLGPFLQLTATYYSAPLQELDFAGDAEGARKTINAWVAERTADKIPELLGPGVVNGQTALVLTNAIYFKGLWERPFDPARTKPMPFKSGAKTIQTPMMSQRGRFAFGEIEGGQVLELPYVGGRLRMVLVLPTAADGLAKLEAALAADPVAFDAWIAACTERDVEVSIPRFTVDSSFSLGDALQALGMRAAFGAADFSGMNGGKDLRISAVVHRAFVQVTEEGTEAAAATAVVMTRSLVPRFIADHPFLFAIRDAETGGIIFLGRLVAPA